MSLHTIAAHFKDQRGRGDNREERRVLTKLRMVYEGGSLDGKTVNFPSRDISRVVVGCHRGTWHCFETYNRTIWLSVRNRRTIFRCAGLSVQSSDSNRWKGLLAALDLRKLKAIVI